MRIILTDHVRLRMRQRGVSISSIRLALNKPFLHKLSYPPAEIVQVIDSKGTLEVVFKRSGRSVVVITAYYL
ncbi:hypothetical protein COU14_02780 [Candidatus Kaiserbacteria bacterium CG10_big_fil_rev_8_21_14_0_10_44_10]|uniref:DUF4258 domain-containing protein n=1 Tax=Candidatus Kaiserbacteria bacterium CG10_big_fil_rev_8_21_14_0_10_44_10 TaxID=1974606 RepID=A0A2H0UH63_9BACT|nr:MAG: hypothetical protein COU14_02780 [Candidatus Kaiserbacteria bacterium CG10_big_fil_rev_8_21_14_0_10_44_10]